MSKKAWQPLIAVAVALGIPAAAAVEWHRLVARHAVAALALAVGWLVACGAGAAVRQALAGPAQRRLEQAGNAADRAVGWWLSGYGRRYRRWVLDSRRYVEVKDLATGGDHTPQLDDVYVDVALVRRAPHQVSANPIGSVPEEATGRHSVSEFLDHARPAVLAVLGPPGCGKSTLLAHIACQTASARRRQRRRIPVLLALREQAATVTANSQQVLADIIRLEVSGMPGSEPAGWWDRQLQRGRCVILLDGLDEVARDEDRHVVTKWVERQINRYPGNDFVVTSRPHGYPNLVIAHAVNLAVLPFNAEQVKLFLNRWYLTPERHATRVSTDAEMRSVRMLASKSADRLIALLRVNPGLHDLTVNPLLLSMIATVHRYRGDLPGSRADLYAEICQVMLSRRIQAKDLPEVLPWPTKQKLLAALAYQMMLDHVSELSAEQALEILGRLMRRLSGTVTGQAFLDDVSRNGLLAEPVPGRYTFAHLTFQEYLAARHIKETAGLAETLVRAVDDQWWRESILLYTAIADADQIVSACLDKETIRALALAFDCAEASGELAPDLRERLAQARNHAFAEDCDPQYQQLIAGVLAVRLSREVIITSAASRVCSRPVPADLYWLFLRANCAPSPNDLHGPDHDSPAVGMWSDDAVTFVRWLNEVTAGSSQVEFRLPGPNELEQVTDQVIKGLPASVTGLWARQTHSADAELWIPPGCSHPHYVTTDAIELAVEADARNTGIVASILMTTALDAAFAVFQLLLAYVAKGAGDDDAAFSGILALSRAFVFALARDLGHDLGEELDHDLARARDIARTNSRGRDIDRREDVLGVAFDLAYVADLDLDLALAREPGLHLDRDVASFNAKNLVSALDRAYESSRVADARRRGYSFIFVDPFAPGRVVDTPVYKSMRSARLAVHVLEGAEVPLTWASRGPLGEATRATRDAASDAGSSEEIFTKRLMEMAHIRRADEIKASPGISLIDSLRHISKVLRQDDDVDHGWSLADATSWLANTAAPLLGSRYPPADSEAASVRLVALALAACCAGRNDDAVAVFHTLAATVTLLQMRAEGTAAIGEGIVLALA